MSESRLAQDQALIQQLMDYQSARNWEGVRGLLADDAVFAMPFLNETCTGKEAILERWQPAASRLQGSKFYDLMLQPLADPGCYVGTFRNDCIMGTTGLPYNQAYIAILHVRDNKISYFAEYFDTLRLAFAQKRVQPAG